MARRKPYSRAAIITDIHYGFDSGAKFGSKAPRLMQAFEKAVARHKPDFGVDIGDRVSTTSGERDTKNMETLQQYFNRMTTPVHHVMGNHDLSRLSRQENERITGGPASSYSNNVGDFHFVFWNPDMKPTAQGWKITEDDLNWLKNDLAQTSRKTILFSHIPLDHEDKADPHPYENILSRFHYADSDNIRKVLEDTGNVMLCMNGHVHRNHHSHINGIHYISQQSLTQTYQKHYRVPAGAWSWLEIDDDKITVKLQGKVRKDYTIPLAA